MRIHRLAIAAALVLLVAFLAPAQAGELCELFAVTGATFQNGFNEPFVGTIDFQSLGGGKSYQFASATVLLGILADGTAITTHDLSTNGLRLTTFDEQALIPTGTQNELGQDVLGLPGRLVVKTGKGRYNCGEIVSGLDTTQTPPAPLSTITFFDGVNPGRTSLAGFAKLCKCACDDDDDDSSD